jgi:hypothetical protein
LSDQHPFLEPSLVLKRSPRSKKMNLATHKFITRRSWKSKTDVLEARAEKRPVVLAADALIGSTRKQSYGGPMAQNNQQFERLKQNTKNGESYGN